MKPILFDANETEFLTHGIGTLTDAFSCVVTEELNGSFELELEYPIDGIHAESLVHSNVILADPSDGEDAEPFRIYAVSKPMNGIVTVNAEHISYQLSHIPCAPFTAENVIVALQKLKQNAVEACPFTFYTDKDTNANYNQKEPASIRQRLAGIQGSILDVYGGEYKFEKYKVSLLAHRGTDRGVTLRYGKNITDIKQEENIQNTFTGVYPYWKDTEDEITDLPEKVVNSEYADNYPFHRTIMLDLSAEWNEAPTEAQLRARAQAYINANSVGIPKVSVSVSFIPLWQTEEYKNIAALERVKLGDVVSVFYEKLGITAYAKVKRTVYDVLLDRYRSIELGEARANFVKSVVSDSTTFGRKIVEEANFRTQAITKATNMITGASGGNIRMIFDADDNPIEQVIMDTKDIMTAQKVWRWNLGGLGYSNNGYNGDYGLAITQDGAINADYISVGTLDANLLRAGVISDRKGNTTWDLENGIIESTQLQVNSTHFNLSKAGNLEATEAYLSGVVRTGSLTGYNVRLEGDSVDFLYGDSQFATIRGGEANNVRQVYFEGSPFNFAQNVVFSGRTYFGNTPVFGTKMYTRDVQVPSGDWIDFGGDRYSGNDSVPQAPTNYMRIGYNNTYAYGFIGGSFGERVRFGASGSTFYGDTYLMNTVYHKGNAYFGESNNSYFGAGGGLTVDAETNLNGNTYQGDGADMFIQNNSYLYIRSGARLIIEGDIKVTDYGQSESVGLMGVNGNYVYLNFQKGIYVGH